MQTVHPSMAGRVTRARMLPPQQQDPQPRAKWTASLTKLLADLMVDQVHKGNKQKNSFNKTAWNYICDGFFNKTGLKWDREQLKNRYSVLRRQYVTVKSLLDTTEFAWDESTGNVIANDEVWDRYTKGHVDAELIKSGGCPIYKQLCTIFSEPATNGTHDHAAEFEGLLEESSSGSEEMVSVAEEQEKYQFATLSNRKRGRKGFDGAIAGAILEMATASKLRTAAVQQCSGRYTISKCIQELDEMQGVEEEDYFSAVDLFTNSAAREMFLALKGDKRLTWLQHKCTVRNRTLVSRALGI